jgi:8-oxo-dGTP diphosphatase
VAEPLHVAVAAIRDAQGRVLIAKRPARVHQGNLWEFPGGKLEPGERVEEALRRELWEELHIAPTRHRSLIRIPHHYSDRHVFLDVWQVDAYSGTASGREGQPLRWVHPHELAHYQFPAANRPIVSAMRLPSCYMITGDCEAGDQKGFLQRLQRSLNGGVKLVQLRVKALAEAQLLELGRQAVVLARAAGAQVLLNGSPEHARAMGADGVHLPAQALRRFAERPLAMDQWVAASCHDADELAAAARLGVDFAVLSPVKPTASHPDAHPLGWESFADLVRDVPVPVYALGGLDRRDLADALQARAQGIAAIRGLWG